MTALRVVVDGEPLRDDDAIALWQRFSAYMDENKGDLAGFAKKEGYASIQPAMNGGMPVLVASRTAGQKPYSSAKPVEPPAGRRGGSSGHQGPGRDPAVGRRDARKSAKRR